MKDPAFLFYPNDYLGGTMGMTFEQKGAYMELLMLQFNRGHMDGHMIGQVFGQNYAVLWNAIKDKFVLDDEGRYYNIRLEEEQKKRKAFVSSRLNNIEGINQHNKSNSKNGGHMGGHTTSRMENENICIKNNIKGTANFSKITAKSTALSFEAFWEMYDKKIDRKKVESKYDKIIEADRLLILDHIPKYKLSQPNKKYRKNPEAYLNARAWENEIIMDEPSQPTSSKEVAAIYKLKPIDKDEYKRYSM